MNKISLVAGQVAQIILNIVRKACLQLIFFFKLMSSFLRGMIKKFERKLYIWKFRESY